MNKTLK